MVQADQPYIPVSLNVAHQLCRSACFELVNMFAMKLYSFLSPDTVDWTVWN